MYASPEARNEEISFGATLSPVALRNLFDHSAVHLSVEWRDLPAEAWTRQVRTAQGRTVPASETIWMRTREVWVHAVDLDNGAVFSDIPPDVLRRLIADITAAWASRGTADGLVVLPDLGQGAPALRPGNDNDNTDGSTTVSGPLPALARWATGRGTMGITAVKNGTVLPEVPAAPRWI